MTDKGEGFGQRPGRRLRIGRIGVAATTQFCRQRLGLGINQFQVHRGVVGTGSLVDIDVETVLRFHLK